MKSNTDILVLFLSIVIFKNKDLVLNPISRGFKNMYFILNPTNLDFKNIYLVLNEINYARQRQTVSTEQPLFAVHCAFGNTQKRESKYKETLGDD